MHRMPKETSGGKWLVVKLLLAGDNSDSDSDIEF